MTIPDGLLQVNSKVGEILSSLQSVFTINMNVLRTGFWFPPENEAFALVSDIPALSGGYSTSQIDDKFALKQDAPDLSQDPDNRFVARNEVYLTGEIDTNHYTKTEINTNHYTKGESDGNYLGSVTIGSVTTLPYYGWDGESAVPNQASVVNVGTGNNVILDFAIPSGQQGARGSDGANGANGANGADGEDGEDGAAGAAGAAASAAAILAAVGNYYQTNSLPSAQDFTDATDNITTLTDDKVSKPDDWNAMNNPTGLVPETELNPFSLDSYVYTKV